MKNWDTVEKSQEELMKMVKRRQKTSGFMKAKQEVGEVYDPYDETVKKISECTSSTLNRIAKSLGAFYKASANSDVEIRDMLIKKKIEIEAELRAREK